MDPPERLKPFARELFLPRAALRLFYYDTAASDGRANLPTMVMVHGLGDEADTWRGVIPTLSRRYRIIAPDLPGFGRSSLPRRPRLSPPFLRDTLVELLDAIGVKRATLVGSSLGASLVQLVALARGDLAERLVLVDGAMAIRSRLRASLLISLLPGIGELRYRRLARNLDAAYASLRPYYGKLDALPEEQREFLRRRVGERVRSDRQRRAYFSVYRELMRWMIRSKGARIDSPSAIDTPTLYLWGADDRIFPLSIANSVSSLQPGARLEVIPAAGHLPHQENPAAFLRAIEGGLPPLSGPAGTASGRNEGG